MKILESASKVVFVLMALAVVVGLFTGNITNEQFIVLASMAFTFYFANKGNSENDYLNK